ncbi:hypothetical protein [Methylobacterium sp. J-076]|uniref:hypothetical protein n=1 Tax=Methylobacterium sp. J-076 TaxID=2836655 RepID=UPI001FB9B506|nr:hypothetical protein [Methylobacterium sp. J-076]MCJ2013897.1 hypothetical protein [Methylobacterium sp. J-076]
MAFIGQLLTPDHMPAVAAEAGIDRPDRSGSVTWFTTTLNIAAPAGPGRPPASIVADRRATRWALRRAVRWEGACEDIV